MASRNDVGPDLFVFVGLAVPDGEILFYVWVISFEFGEQSFVGQVQRVRVGPVFLESLVDATDDVRIVDLDGEFATAVEAAWGQVDGTDDGAGVVGKDQLGVQLDVPQLVDLDAEVLKDAQAADAFDEFFLLEFVRRPGHDLNLYAAGVGADKVLDDRGVLVALVLQPQGVGRAVDELAEALAAVADAPDKMGLVVGVELVALPVGVEASATSSTSCLCGVTTA